MKREYLSLKVYEWFYIVFWCTLISIVTFINGSTIYAIISCLFGVIAASLNIFNKRTAFIFYVLYALSYGIISFLNNNYGEALLNIFYNTPLYIFTVYKLFYKNKIEGVKIQSLNIKKWIIISLIIPFVTIIYGTILNLFENSNMPYVNALATGFAIVSSFMASKRYKEQWIFWIGYSIVLIYLWMFNDGEQAYLYLNIFYTITNVIGLILWYKKYKYEKNIVAIENK